MREKLRDGAEPYEQARCVLADCGASLRIVYTISQDIYLDSTSRFLAAAATNGGCAVTWHVECEGGHTVLLPLDTCESEYVFGQCGCEPDEIRPAAECPHGDLNRLRAVTAI
jgi:hypothetical protein